MQQLATTVKEKLKNNDESQSDEPVPSLAHYLEIWKDELYYSARADVSNSVFIQFVLFLMSFRCSYHLTS
eukprot:snap_masked-scaffold_13-processed-gene-6.35-mRNA-1 protein AED:1.00 eAED:1.00 QI:0/0/0/0/1/1/2/0/69